MRKLLIPIVVAIVVIGFIFFKDKLPKTQNLGNISNSSPVMTADQVAALGGTCYTSPFTDESGDVSGSKAGETKNTKYPEKNEFDMRQITVGVDGENVVFLWEFGAPLPADSHHTISFNIDQVVPNETDKGTFDVRWTAAEQKWTGGHFVAGGWDSVAKDFKPGSQKSFDPAVQMSGNNVFFRIPLAYFVPDVNRLSFYTQTLAKQEGISYIDNNFNQYVCP